MAVLKCMFIPPLLSNPQSSKNNHVSVERGQISFQNLRISFSKVLRWALKKLTWSRSSDGPDIGVEGMPSMADKYLSVIH